MNNLIEILPVYKCKYSCVQAHIYKKKRRWIFLKIVLKDCYFNTFSILLYSLLIFLKGEKIKDLKEGKRRELGESPVYAPNSLSHKTCLGALLPNYSCA